MKSHKVVFISVVIFIVIVATVVLALTTQKSSINSDQTNQSDGVTITQSVIDTSDWQTYRNEEMGFEFRYPNTWEYIVEESGQVKFYDIQKERYLEGSETYLVSASARKLEAGFTFEEWFASWSNTRKKYGGEVRKVMFNDLNAFQGIDYLGTQTVIYWDNKVYSINQVNLGSPEANLEIENIYKALLNSWRFID